MILMLPIATLNTVNFKIFVYVFENTQFGGRLMVCEV